MNIKLSSLNKGLVAHWTMSQDSLKGSLLADKTPYSNDGTIYGATFATDRMGQPNKAMSFDGTDDHISIADSNSLSFGNGTTDTPFTITWWTKMTVSNGAKHITKKSEYFINNTNAFRVNLTDASTGGYLQAHFGTPSAFLNQWVMFTVTYDGSSTAAGIKAYWNAVEKTGANESSGTYVAMENSASNLTLGTDGAGYFSGLIDDVRIYNRALSEEEIKTLYNSYNPNIKMKTSLPKIKLSKALKGIFVDSRDGTEYKTIKIGNQTWMAENLAYLPAVHSNAEFVNQTTSARYGVYGYNGSVVATAKAQANYTTYGVLYNYAAALTACPTGWHLPSHDEWTTLERAICTSGTCLADFPKDTTTTGWRGTNEGSKLSTLTLNGNNSSGFTALMSGGRSTDGSFYNVGSRAYFWSSSEGGAGAWSRNCHASGSAVYRNADSKAFGFSVRCIRDY